MPHLVDVLLWNGQMKDDLVNFERNLKWDSWRDTYVFLSFLNLLSAFVTDNNRNLASLLFRNVCAWAYWVAWRRRLSRFISSRCSRVNKFSFGISRNQKACEHGPTLYSSWFTSNGLLKSNKNESGACHSRFTFTANCCFFVSTPTPLCCCCWRDGIRCNASWCDVWLYERFRLPLLGCVFPLRVNFFPVECFGSALGFANAFALDAAFVCFFPLPTPLVGRIGVGWLSRSLNSFLILVEIVVSAATAFRGTVSSVAKLLPLVLGPGKRRLFDFDCGSGDTGDRCSALWFSPSNLNFNWLADCIGTNNDDDTFGADFCVAAPAAGEFVKLEWFKLFCFFVAAVAACCLCGGRDEAIDCNECLALPFFVGVGVDVAMVTFATKPSDSVVRFSIGWALAVASLADFVPFSNSFGCCWYTGCLA